MREIHSLKNELSHLRTEVLYLQCGKLSNTSVSTNVCFLYVHKDDVLATSRRGGNVHAEELPNPELFHYSQR